MDTEFDTLLKNYRKMFSMVDVIHFNSQNTADVYARYIDVPQSSAVVPITHGSIEDHRQLRLYGSDVLHLGFIGNEAPYKGLPTLKRVIRGLNDAGYMDKFCLYVYGGRTGVDEHLKNVEYRGRFSSSQMYSIYDSMDLLIVPSICYETFGFTTIEAIQFGVPALVSNKVGSKDIVESYAPHFIFNNEAELFSILLRLLENRKELIDYNRAIVTSPWNWSLEEHSSEIVNTFYQYE